MMMVVMMSMVVFVIVWHIIYWPVSQLGLTDECLDLGNPFWLAEIPAMGIVPLCHWIQIGVINLRWFCVNNSAAKFGDTSKGVCAIFPEKTYIWSQLGKCFLCLQHLIIWSLVLCGQYLKYSTFHNWNMYSKPFDNLFFGRKDGLKIFTGSFSCWATHSESRRTWTWQFVEWLRKYHCCE